jgi:glutamate-1-semialdehyde 2,1-aminomutase
MALGASALGYADSVVTASVIEALRAGNVSGLSPVLEIVVAERLSEVIPCAEQVRFLKTGAEGVAAAVRLARAATGRPTVLACGYFGWLDWSNPGTGVPAGATADVFSIPFDDTAALERAVAEHGSSLAAIVIEPVIERLPSEEWIRAARAACDRVGAVLVFDEVKTGFRLRTGGYQALVGVEPDLAVFGKALANGFPLSAVAGRAEIMQHASHTWISSTLASETGALAAANAVLDWHERAEVCEALWEAGEEMMQVMRGAIDASGIQGVSVEGIAPMWWLDFAEPASENRFVALAAEYGVLLKRGAYNFPSLAHEDDAMRALEYAASSAFAELAAGE